MSLKYKVLWVDDNKDEFSKEEKALNSFIEELFFEPKIDFCEDIATAKKFIDTEKYDVIFSDYNIDEEKGDDFISFIRGKSVNTEVLFYSGQNQLPEGRLDRVTFFFETGSHREERLLKKMKELILLTVAKLDDLTQLRGLVMAEVSELDDIMKNLVAEYCTKSSEAEIELRNYIVEKIEERAKATLDVSQVNCEKKCFHEWKNKSVQEVVFEQNFDSYTTARALNYIMEKYKEKLGIDKFLSNYTTEIIQNRNELAHCKAVQRDDGSEVLATKKGEKEFTPAMINDIRKNIIKYHKLFENIEQIIENN